MCAIKTVMYVTFGKKKKKISELRDISLNKKLKFEKLRFFIERK